MAMGKISKFLIIFLVLGFIPFTGSVSEIDVLVIDDGHNLTNYDEAQYTEGMFRDDYLNTLESIEGVDAELETTDYGSSGELGPPVEVLRQYDAIVWYTLSDRGGSSGLDNIEETLKPEDQNRISDYLKNHSGTFLLTGHRISYDISQAESEEVNFYKEFLGVESNPGSYYRGKLREDGTFKGGSFDEIQLRDMTYDEANNLALAATDSQVFNSGEVFNINTTLESFDDFRTISDICDNRLDDESQEGCLNRQESLRWMNNIPTGSPSGDVTVSNTNSNSQTDTDSLKVSYDEAGEGKVLLVGTTTVKSDDNSTGINSAKLKDGRKLRQIEKVTNGNITNKVYMVRNPKEYSDENSVILSSDNETHMSAIAVTLSGAATGVTLGPVRTNSSNQSKVSTSINNEEGEKIIDFVSSRNDLSTSSGQNDMTDVDLGNREAGFYVFRKEGTGEQEMEYKDGRNYTQITLNIERDTTDAEYVIEQDDEQLDNNENPDEYATALSTFYNNSYRSTVASFGFESVKRNRSKNKLMKQTLRYLTGPVANQTTASAVNNRDLPYTDIDESRYTSKYADISSTGLNDFNPSKISNARYFYSNSSLGFEPALEYPIEYEQNFVEDWDIRTQDAGRWGFGGACGSKFGEKALALAGTDQNTWYNTNNDIVSLYSPEFDASDVSSLTLEFWAKAASEDDPCDKPESGEDLIVYYKDSDGNFNRLDALEPTDYRGEWIRYEKQIPSNQLHEDTQIVISRTSDKGDVWLIDGFSVHQKLGITADTYSNTVEVGEEVIDLTEISPSLSNEPTGLNLSIGAQFKDSSNQGYWGDTEKTWMVVDTQEPDVQSATSFSANEHYSNDEIVTFTYDNEIIEDKRADYIRLSCDSSSGDWSRWKKLDKNQVSEEISFDITDTSAGCTSVEGNRTVYGQFRDYAGNIPDHKVQDWVFYDTTPPTFEGETPDNLSAIQTGKEVYINASDNEELDNSKTRYFNGEENISFTPNVKFDPQFSSEGLTTGVAYIFDKASNLNKEPVAFDLDDTSPASNVTPQNKEIPTNNSVVNLDFNMVVNITEDNFDRVKINDGDGNDTYWDKDVKYQTSWSEGASQDLILWMRDRAGNKEMANYTYDVDDTPPTKGAVKEKNQSYILNSTKLGYNFSDSITHVVGTSVSENKVGLSRYDLGVETSWTTEGTHYLQVNASDVLNKRNLNFTYIVDETPPETDIHFPDYSQNTWTNTDVSVDINATDNMNMSTISYCKRSTDGSCQLDSESQPDKNVSETITCAEGNTCRKVLEYNSRDSAGNKFSSESVISPKIKIDREKPQIDNLRPSEGTTSGNVTISSDISDAGSGISNTEITIYNSSDPSQVYEQGSMSERSDEWTYEWNSEDYITGAGDVTVNISASDQFNYNKSKESQFRIDNQRVNVRIDTPFQQIVNEGFRLNITAVRPGLEDVYSHNYSINQSSTEIYSNNTISINEGTHRYDLVFDTSEISDDGNYTLNTSANGGGHEYASTETWFYLDREAPETEVLSELNDTWQTGEITVDFKAYDTVENGSLKYRYRDNGGSWAEESLTYGQGSFTFPTSERCDDDSQADCQIKLVAEDEAGNVNTSVVSFKVDNSRPSVNIDSPEAFSWQNGDFQVERTIKDEEAENSEEGLSCSYRINNSGSYQISGCNSSVTVDIPQDYQDEKFKVSFKATNPAGLEREVDRTFRIDTNPPQVTQSYPRPGSDSIINGSQSITFYFEDDFSIIEYQVLDDGNNRQSISEGETYEPDWSTSGERTLDLELNDTAGNFKENSYTYTFDNKEPEVNSTSLSRPYDDYYGEVRVYRGQALRFNASVIENIKMEKAVLELNETGTVNEYSLNAPDDLQNGTWSMDLPTETSGYYNFTSLKLVDEAGNKVTNTSLEGYRVVNYSQTVKLGGNSEIIAGREQEFNLTVDFNRTVGERNLELYVPPSSPESIIDPYYSLSDLTCEISGCSISATENVIDLNYTGNREVVNVTGNVSAKTENNDRNQPFVSDIADNTRESSSLLKTPELEVGNLTCESSCDVDQFANFTLDADALNNQTSDNTGKAFDVTLSISSNSSQNPIEKTRNLDNILSGEGPNTETFENLSFNQAGTFKVQTVIEDLTGEYSGSASIDVNVRDVLKPKVNDTRPSTSRININDSIELESNITDNTNVKSANLTLELPNGTERILNISRARGEIFISTFENTSDQGVYNITKVEALDQAGNERTVNPGATFKVLQLRVDANVSETNISNNEAVNFSLNITGNSSEISDVEINATTPKEEYRVTTYNEVTTNDTLRFDKFENSGNYSFNVTVNSDFSVNNQTEDVFVRFGNGNITALSGENDTILIPEGGDVDVPWRVLTENGSIRDVSLEFDSSDTGIISAPLNTEDIGNLTAEEGQKTAEFTFSPESTGNTSVDMTVAPQNGTQNFTSVDIWVNETDQKAPEITDYEADESVLNLGENQSFTADVEEKSVIKNLTLKIESNETGNTWNKQMDRTGKGSFGYNFSESGEVGFYNYSITAYDVSGNNMTRKGNYTVSDNYQIQVSHGKDTYVKGDTPQFDIEVQDMSGEEVENYSAEVKLEKGSEETTLASGYVEETSTTIFSSDPPSASKSPGSLPLTYNLEVNVTKDQNQGLYTEGIDVTRKLNIREFEVVEEFIPEGGNFTVQGRWVEPGGYKVDGKSPSFLSCRGCEEKFKQFNKINSSTNLRRQTLSVSNGTDSVLVQAVVDNAYGNSESQLKNDPEPTIEVEMGGQGTELNGTNGPGGGLGGIGGGGGPTMTINRISPNISIGSEVQEVNLSVRTDLSSECRYTPNPAGESFPYSSAEPFTNTGGRMHYSTVNLEETSSPFSYSVLCSADSVNQSTSIFFSRNNTEVSNFRPSLPRSITRGNDSISQRSNGTGSFRLFNEGGDPVEVEFEINSECCEAWVQKNSQRVDKAQIQSQEQEEFDIFVNTPLSADRGVHTLTLSIEGENTTVNRTVSFDVARSELVQRYYDLRSQAGILNSSIERYDIAGIDTSKERKLFDELQKKLRLANKSINQDKKEELRQALKSGQTKAEKIDQGLKDDSLKKYVLLNWWKWATGFVITYMAFFLIVMVAIPYYRIRTELTRINGELDRQIEARKKGEKQYFKRQIDKDTFNSMMQERQNNVLELRGEKEDLKEELDGFLWTQLTLENYIKAPSKGMKELEKWWAANKRARQNMNKEDEGQ